MKHTWKHEQNFRIQVIVALGVIIAMLAFRVSRLEAVALMFVIVAVLVLELLNSVVERFIDLLKPRLSQYAQVIKDMMAAAVFLSSLGAIIVGITIFYPYLATLVQEYVV